MTTTYRQLKVQAAINLDNYRATRNPFYLNRAINQTRLAIQFLRSFSPLPHDGRPYISHKTLETLTNV